MVPEKQCIFSECQELKQPFLWSRMISGDRAEMCASIELTVERGANGGGVYGEKIVAFHPLCGAQAARAKKVTTVLFMIT